jgi:hypothetical protein
MTATKRYVNHLRNKCFFYIDEALERYILSIYEEEPFPNEWSEQDLYEQIRKLVCAYNRGELVIPVIPSKYNRLKNRYLDLQNDISDLAILYYRKCGELPGQFDYLNVIAAASVEGEEAQYEE